MKKSSFVLLMSFLLAACSQSYTAQGNASIVSSKQVVGTENVELTIKKDDGEVVKMVREYDSHAAVGARVIVGDAQENHDEDLKTIRRYEFK